MMYVNRSGAASTKIGSEPFASPKSCASNVEGLVRINLAGTLQMVPPTSKTAI